MTFTYLAGQTTDLNRVRLLIGDTDSTDVQLQDEEIADMLSLQPNRYFAAASCAELIAAKYARLVDYTAKNAISESASQVQTHYAALATQMRRLGSRAGVVPYAGGISQSDKRTQNTDQDRIPESFTAEMEREPGTEGITVVEYDRYPL